MSDLNFATRETRVNGLLNCWVVVQIAEKKSKGWVKIYRDIQSSEIWLDPTPFNWRDAWIDLLLMANHEERTIVTNLTKETVVIKAGQLLTSMVHLSDRWTWSRPRVNRYLDRLKDMDMITYTVHPYGTLVTIVKYGFFQFGQGVDDTTDVTTVVTSDVTTDVTADVTRTRMNKNEKNYKNDEEGILSGKPDPVPDYFFDEVIGYLNQKIGAKYQPDSADTRELIKARVEDGFTLEDFKTVIDKKVAEWKDDEKMAAFLRPSTLFGTKFESYLNQQVVKGKSKNRFNNFPQREYDFADFEKQLLNASLGGG